MAPRRVLRNQTRSDTAGGFGKDRRHESIAFGRTISNQKPKGSAGPFLQDGRYETIFQDRTPSIKHIEIPLAHVCRTNGITTSRERITQTLACWQFSQQSGYRRGTQSTRWAQSWCRVSLLSIPWLPAQEASLAGTAWLFYILSMKKARNLEALSIESRGSIGSVEGAPLSNRSQT